MTARRLVFGDDGSAAADTVWLWVNSHEWPGWTISVVAARQPREFAVLPPERAAPHPWRPEHPRELLGDHPDTVVEHLMAEADPRVVLDSSGQADLMVVGPRGHGALKQLHVGSTTEWLLVRPSPPLAIIRSGQVTRRVAVCVDGSPHARLAATTLAALPWISRCEVVLLAVDDGSTDTEAALEEGQAILSAVGADPRPMHVDGRHHGMSMTRDVRSVILGEVAALDVDLVALGTRGANGMRRMVTGSTASAVALHAPCSVLVAYDENVEDESRHA